MMLLKKVIGITLVVFGTGVCFEHIRHLVLLGRRRRKLLERWEEDVEIEDELLDNNGLPPQVDMPHIILWILRPVQVVVVSAADYLMFPLTQFLGWLGFLAPQWKQHLTKKI